MKPVKHPIVIAAALLAAGLLSTPASHADAFSEAYNAGYEKGYEKGFKDGQNVPGGGGGQNNIILTAPPFGGFPGMFAGSESEQPEVGFFWDSKEWQAYKLKDNATNTITPGAGLPMSEWAKNPAELKKYGFDSSTVAPHLEMMRKAFAKKYPNANIWVSPGAKTQ